MESRISWISQQKILLEKERAAEVEASTEVIGNVSLKTLEAKGTALSKLIVEDFSTGLFGYPLLTFCRKSSQPGVKILLPSHTFTSGDIVGIWDGVSATNKQLSSGVIVKVTTGNVQVALDRESPNSDEWTDGGSIYRLHKLSNDVTYNRIKAGLELVERNAFPRSYHLVQVLFGESHPLEPLPSIPEKLLAKNGELQLFNDALDDSQTAAVRFCLCQKDLAIVHGPPGTGKTTTVVEAILQHVKIGSKVLVVAPSNLAVDNLLERLVAYKVSVVRVGHPARATQKAQQRTLDALIRNSDDYEILRDIRSDIKSSLNVLKDCRDKGKRYKAKQDIKHFRKELRERETRIAREILKHNPVVLTTLTGAGLSGPFKLLPEDHFDLVVVDECSQGLECACYASVMRAPKLILAGDHRQLPPTVLSKEAAHEGFLVSLMERLVDIYKDKVTRMLTTQYRMNDLIMRWSSEAMYDGRLVASASVAHHTLPGLDGVRSNEETETPLCFVDTAGCDLWEVTGEDLSKGNEGEASVVAEVVERLLRSGVAEHHVAVITPYNLQVEMIRSTLGGQHPLVEVRSVDGFQGREKEAVVISMVRSNDRGDIGFLGEERRLNVAVTRARRHLTVVGDSDTISCHPFIRSLIDHIVSHGVVMSARELQGDSPSSRTKLLPQSSPRNPNHAKCASKKRSLKSDEEKQVRTRELTEAIDQFISSEEQFTLEFPKELNAFERLLIHEIASKKGVHHCSHGEKSERRIVVSKNREECCCASEDNASKSACEVETLNCAASRTSDSTSQREYPCSDDLGRTCSDSSGAAGSIVDAEAVKPSGSPNLDLKSTSKKTKSKNSSVDHEARLVQKMSRRFAADERTSSSSSGHQKETMSTVVLPSNAGNKVTCKRSLMNSGGADESSMLRLKECKLCQLNIPVRNFDLHSMRCERIQREKEIKSKIDSRKTQIGGGVKSKMSGGGSSAEDEFALMDQFVQENTRCAFPGCKNPSVILLQLCTFCKNNFCLKHHQAEVHGCGEDAKRRARADFKSAGFPPKKPNSLRRAQLEKKLEGKLNTMQQKRSKNKKEK